MLMDVASLSQGQLNKFKHKIGWQEAGGNYRPPQSLNGRTIMGCKNSISLCSPMWGQCGGIMGPDWSGASCCQAGAECVEKSEWYSQCIPSGHAHTGEAGLPRRGLRR